MPINYAEIEKISLENIDVQSMGDKLIMQDINYIRSSLDLKEGDNIQDSTISAQQWARLPESFCHGFYRILGLPVISKNKLDFYNPGFFGSEDTQEEADRRNKIDQEQDETLLQMERKREQVSYDNIKNFDKPTVKIEYRVEMLKNPIDVSMMDTALSDPLTQDRKQIKDNFPGRNKFKQVCKILRPFKCVPFISNNIEPSSKKVCAPFVLDDNILNTSLSRSYIELVCRIRFASDILKSSKNLYTKALLSKMASIGVEDKFIDNINSFSNTESYIFLQMFTSLISICIMVKKDIIKNAQLANELYKIISTTTISTGIEDNINFDSIEAQIAEKKKELAERELILSALPTGTQTIDGVAIRNPIDCKLNNTFISLVQKDINSIRQELSNLETQRSNQIKQFNSINKTSFYLLGEVSGIGLLDIISIMMSFWLIPQSDLIAFLDGSSFKRLYRNPNFQNETVKNRYNETKYSYSGVNISNALSSMDKSVLNLLELCSDIINSS